MTRQTTWHVYVLECHNGRLYTGISTDPARRFEAHARGKGAMFTRINRPQRLLGSLPCSDRSAALRLEYEIKQMSAGAKRQLAASWPAFSPPAAAPAPDSR
ncbi:MAG: GIY-YIG nuclease family protein [Perlucidibaca sp.]